MYSISAHVLVEVRAGRAADAAKAIRALGSKPAKVTAVDVVTGPHDLVVTIEGPSIQTIGEVVNLCIGQVDGVLRTTTCVVLNSL